MEKPILVFLHGVAHDEVGDDWRDTLAESLAQVGYPDLEAVTVIAPQYLHTLRGADDKEPLPPLTVRVPSGEAARRNRREFERRIGALEVALGRQDRGVGIFRGDDVVNVAMAHPYFVQAHNYVNKPQIRAQVLTRVLRQLPESGRIAIVGHSLGSVIAADLIRRLPETVEVGGLVTLGSPLASKRFDVSGLRGDLREPPTNLAWWVNLWNGADPVTAGRGVSTVIPWALDCRVPFLANEALHVHDVDTYLADSTVGTAVGLAVFGSRSKEVAAVDRGVEIPMDAYETATVLALSFAHLLSRGLDGERRARFTDALRQVQANMVEMVAHRNALEGRPLPTAIARLRVDLGDPECGAPEPHAVGHLAREDAVLPLVTIAAMNVMQPFEIAVPKPLRRESMSRLALAMGLGSQFGKDVVDSLDSARRAVQDGPNWGTVAAVGVGAAAIVAATGGLALAAAPGVVGAAAITSALAAFGPGGMIGGLITAGGLVSAGGGSIAFGLASASTAAATVETLVQVHLAAATLRHNSQIEQDPTTWLTLTETGIEVQRELARLEPLSDPDSVAVKELRRKKVAIDRALAYLLNEGMVPEEDARGSDPT